MPRTPRPWRRSKKLRREPRRDCRARRGRQADRNLVPGRGPDRPEEQDHRPALDHYVNWSARMGTSVLISETWLLMEKRWLASPTGFESCYRRERACQGRDPNPKCLQATLVASPQFEPAHPGHRLSIP